MAKMKIKDQRQCEQIQRALFKLGYRWNIHDAENIEEVVKQTRNWNIGAIYMHLNGYMGQTSYDSPDFERLSHYKIINAQSLLPPSKLQLLKQRLVKNK